MSGSRGTLNPNRRHPARASRRLKTLATAALCLLFQGALPAAQAAAAEPTRPALARELLDARSVFLMASPFSALAQHVEKELEQWGRFRLSEFLSDADVVVSLGTSHGFVRLPVGDECGEGDEDPLCDRPVATTPVFDAFKIEIFVQGGEILWKDEVAIEHDDRAAKILVDRLRAGIEAAEASDAGPQEAAPQ